MTISILHTLSILSAPSMIEFLKTLLNCFNWLGMIQIHTGGLQTVIPLLIRGVTASANVYQLMARLSPITLCIIQYNVQYNKCALPQLTSCRGSHLWHVWMYSQTGLYLSTIPCPWLNNCTEILHSQSFKGGQVPEIQSDYANSVNYSLWNFMILYCLHKIQCHLCLNFINCSFSFLKKKHIFDDYINIAHIFNIISAIYDWIFFNFDESFELI